MVSKKGYGMERQASQGGAQNQPAEPIHVPETPENTAALNWLNLAVDLFYEKPRVVAQLPNEIVDPVRGGPSRLRLEFIAGSRRGKAGQPIGEPPEVRLTAGGRPVARAQIDFEVSQVPTMTASRASPRGS
jgi:hypothetical protein